MIIYKATVDEFRDNVETNDIADLIELAFQREMGRRVAPNEKRSWINSLSFMERVVRRSGIPGSCGVLVEYVIPTTSNRIDFFVAGYDEKGNKNFIIVELKQWETAEATEMDGLVTTFVGKGIRETTHPSYQARSYKLFLQDYNANIESEELVSHSCAYLHNFKKRDPEPLETGIYTDLVKDTPIYFQNDHTLLSDFLKKFVGKGNGSDILFEVESGKIRPSKKLIEHVSGIIKGNQEFVLLDEQKIAYETAKHVIETTTEKAAVIIKGGPGTGKSVVSVNLLAGLIKKEFNVVFVAPNAAFREVMIKKLAKEHATTRIRNLFKGSAGFIDVKENVFDAIIVDEAHRLKNNKAFMYSGENQIEDIMNAAKTSIFFIDDNQIIRPEDIGSVEEIKRVAEANSAKIYEMELQAQFRCSGADGYINWLDSVLHIQETANFDGWERKDFEFKIFDDPNKLREAIKAKHDAGKSARLVAGYAWGWTSAREGNADAQHNDIVIPEYSFEAAWNSHRIGTTWAIDPRCLNQIGCIHSSQGLEFDYMGVIVGKDLQFDPEKMEFFTAWGNYKDKKGKQGLRRSPERLNQLVRNIYKILMTRGMKGCYVFFEDPETRKYFEGRMFANKL